MTSQPVPAPAFDPTAWMPEGACDCHTHVFADPAAFPFTANRSYTPETADVDALSRHLARCGLQRVVIVQPSVYGFDNSATLAAMARLGPRVARGVAVIDVPTVTDAELDRLHAAGMRGIRLNLESARLADPARAASLLREASARLQGRGWHIQVYARLALLAKLFDVIVQLDVPVVLDHFGGTAAGTPPDAPGFAALLAAMRSGSVWVKASAGHLCHVVNDDFSGLAPLATALMRANPDRVLWGSDWPHPDPDPDHDPLTSISPLKRIDDAAALANLRRAAPDELALRKALALNAAALYFGD